jgi:hypothetical protein
MADAARFYRVLAIVEQAVWGNAASERSARIGFTAEPVAAKGALDERNGFISHADLLVYLPERGR